MYERSIILIVGKRTIDKRKIGKYITENVI